MRRSPGRALLATALAMGAPSAACAACGSSASPEKTGTETFGCYVGSCVSPGVGVDDRSEAGADAGDGPVDAQALDRAPSPDGGS